MLGKVLAAGKALVEEKRVDHYGFGSDFDLNARQSEGGKTMHLSRSLQVCWTVRGIASIVLR